MQVVLLWETFLLQMDDFDRLLELKLRELLDQVVARRPPARGRRSSRSAPDPIVGPAPIAPVGLAPEAIPVIVTPPAMP